MILGIGVDLADIDEFRRLRADPATHFFAAHFTAAEFAYARAQASDDPSRHLAARYAAKEAVIKALRGTADVGKRTAIDYREIEIVSQGDGAPRLAFHGAVAEAIRAAGVARAHCSLSHEGGVAIAMVVLER